jgi:UDP-N-acetyl-2-amino-2-deoxyglucuronate dehydrogenase
MKMHKNELNWAVVGACGGIGRAHCKVVKAMRDAKLIAIVDSNVEAGKALAEELGCSFWSTVEEMLNSVPDLNCASIATPPPMHAGAAVPLLQAGINALVEKPFASTLYDADRILSAARQSGAQVGTICQRRYLKPCQRVAKAIDNDEIGTPTIVNVNMYGWRSPAYYQAKAWLGTWKGEGGALLVNQAPHQLDLMLRFVNSPVRRVMARWKNVAHANDIECEDTVWAWVEFENGCTANVFMTNAMNPGIHCNVHITGSNNKSVGVQTDKGPMFVAGASGNQGVSKPAEPPMTDIWECGDEVDPMPEWQREEIQYHSQLPDAVLHYHGLLFQDFNEAVQNGTKFEIDGKAGRNVVELVSAIYLSHSGGNVWIDCPLMPDRNGWYHDGRPIPTPFGDQKVVLPRAKPSDGADVVDILTDAMPGEKWPESTNASAATRGFEIQGDGQI